MEGSARPQNAGHFAPSPYPKKKVRQKADLSLFFKSPYCSIARSTWHLPIWGLPDFTESLLSVTLNKRNVIYLYKVIDSPYAPSTVACDIYRFVRVHIPRRAIYPAIISCRVYSLCQHNIIEFRCCQLFFLFFAKINYPISSCSFFAEIITASKCAQNSSQFSFITAIFSSFAAISRTRASSPKISAPMVFEELFTACT